MLNSVNMSLTNLVSVPATNMDNIPDMHEEPNILNLNPCVNGFYASEEETLDEDGNDNEDYESENISDFEETIDVTGNNYLDDDIEKIYVERGIKCQPFKKDPNGKIKLAKDQLFFNVDHSREILKDYAIQERFQLHRV
ncbi:hypothetical protein JHK82_025131 [Glycine max]|nr:hypothetical protein JHK82_025131 [Glycine max]